MATEHHTVARKITAMLVVTLVLFPKGGFRAGSIPVTWGYILLGLLSIVLLPYRLLVPRAVYLPNQLIALACCAPFFLLFCYTAIMFGVSSDLSGFATELVNFAFLPWIFLWLFPPLLDHVDGARLVRLLRFCMLAAALFGIINFFWRPFTGFFLNIPFVTANGNDLDPSFTKNIARGFFFKLISTYNNGNIYGVATLILINLYDVHTPERWQRWTLRLALALTLSRTVWAGMILDILLTLGAVTFRELKRFPWINLRRIRTPLVLAGLTVLAIIGLTVSTGLLGRGGDFLLDSSLGGRVGLITRLGGVPWFPDGANGFFFAEIVYASAINIFGYIGLPAITLLLCSPMLILLVDRSALANPTRRAAAKGLILYALLCCSDGTISLIPTMAFFWFTYMVFLFGIPSFGRVVPVEGDRPTSAFNAPATSSPWPTAS